MSNFKIGEKVVCVEPIYNLIKGEIYSIEKFDYCCSTNVMLKGVIKDSNTISTKCRKCNQRLLSNDFFDIGRFRKLDHQFSEKICAEILESVRVKEEQLN